LDTTQIVQSYQRWVFIDRKLDMCWYNQLGFFSLQFTDYFSNISRTNVI